MSTLIGSIYDYLILLAVSLIGSVTHFIKGRVKQTTDLNFFEWMFKNQPGANSVLAIALALGVGGIMTAGPLGIQAVIASFFMGYSADSLVKMPLKIPGKV